MNFVPSTADPCIYIRSVLVSVYVDDIIVENEKQKSLDEVRGMLLETFEVKDLGELKFCLGINVMNSRNCISMSQGLYIYGMLQKFQMQSCKPVKTQMELLKEEHTVEVEAGKPRRNNVRPAWLEDYVVNIAEENVKG